MIMNLATLAWRNIRTRRARSWLTILGMLIGVMAIVTLISIGTGVEHAVLQQFEDVGLDVVLLVPKESTFSPSASQIAGEDAIGELRQITGEFSESPESQSSLIGLDDDSTGSEHATGVDLKRLQSDVPEITEAGQIATTVLDLSAGDVSGFVRVMIPSWDLVDRFPGLLGGFAISQGRGFAAASDRGVVLGARAASLTGTTVGDTVTIDGHQLTVIGILEPSRESQVGVNENMVTGRGAEAFRSLSNTDDAAIILQDQAQKLWPNFTMSSIVAIRIRTGVSVTDTIVRINDAVARQGVFMTPVSTQALADNVQRTLGMVKVVLASIAAISLLVGAIGMMNTMYTSVLERTREIGILKSVGAKDRHVLCLFLIDSGLMGLTGGVLGLGLGMGASFLGTRLLGDLIGVTSFLPFFAPWLLLGAIALSFVLGALAGVWPAWHAARLDPVNALAAD